MSLVYSKNIISFEKEEYSEDSAKQHDMDDDEGQHTGEELDTEDIDD